MKASKESRRLKIELRSKLTGVSSAFYSVCNNGAYVMVAHSQAAKMFEEISKHYAYFTVDKLTNNTIFEVPNSRTDK